MTPAEWNDVKERLANGDQAVFERLYTGLWSKLYSVAFNYVRDKETAQEIVQETFIRLWDKRKQLGSVKDIGAFSMRSLQFRIYDHFDKKQVEQRYLRVASKNYSWNVDDVHQQVEYDETFNLLNTEIEKLPDTTRRIFRLSRFDHFTNEEIAKTLRLSVKAVEYHISRSLKHLRLRLGNFLSISIALALAFWQLLTHLRG